MHDYMIDGDEKILKKGLNRYVLTDEIYSLLKEQILNHQIAPGEKINIDQLAREFEVSNIPIREALSRLASERLVSVVPFKGMYAMEMTLQELDEIFEIRKELECLAIRKAALRIPDSLLSKLESEMSMLSGKHTTDLVGSIEFIAEMNQNLHGLILDYCENQSLKELIQAYIQRIQRYLLAVHQEMNQRVLEEEWKEHMEVVRCLASKNVQDAEHALLNHLDRSHLRTRSLFS
ncbi:GntR family transcriptional regulator [Paenibacillus sp. LHD-117]|uniref:GntR family transcriptional regulator n=1 Tax=Paenibacillus sp. LHD-117 TaxID=3071412 RepID=UPI0027E0B758|nr:GntR family transcriptional regulator [Paenibacillus sp. LHD-117]MDQ6419746.1 GntR family transcriptional regulator [Paenibacillus sp. LHD-117]